uniref:DUF4283 domain-containing protein n=1 Tax=Ascaris lumbricoides TaxID=6252 RepID=A0A0M3HV98_ASCLU
LRSRVHQLQIERKSANRNDVLNSFPFLVVSTRSSLSCVVVIAGNLPCFKRRLKQAAAKMRDAPLIGMETVKGVVVEMTTDEAVVATVAPKGDRIPSEIRLENPKRNSLELGTWLILQLSREGRYVFKEKILEDRSHPLRTVIDQRKKVVLLHVKLDVRRDNKVPKLYGYSPALGNVFFPCNDSLDRRLIYEGFVSWAPEYCRSMLHFNWILRGELHATNHSYDDIIPHNSESDDVESQRVRFNNEGVSRFIDKGYRRDEEQEGSCTMIKRGNMQIEESHSGTRSSSSEIRKAQRVPTWETVFRVFSNREVLKACNEFDPHQLTKTIGTLLSTPGGHVKLLLVPSQPKLLGVTNLIIALLANGWSIGDNEQKCEIRDEKVVLKGDYDAQLRLWPSILQSE